MTKNDEFISRNIDRDRTIRELQEKHLKANANVLGNLFNELNAMEIGEERFTKIFDEIQSIFEKINELVIDGRTDYLKQTGFYDYIESRKAK